MLKSNSASNDLLQNTWWNYHTDLLHVFNVNNNEIVNIQRRPVVSIVKELVLFIIIHLENIFDCWELSQRCPSYE